MADLNLFIDRDGIEPLKKEEVVQEEKGTPSKYDLFLDEFAEEITGEKRPIQEVSPPGWGHTKGPDEGGSAEAFDNARKEGRFKGSKEDMFAIMWASKNKGDKTHYKEKSNPPEKKKGSLKEEYSHINEAAEKVSQFLGDTGKTVKREIAPLEERYELLEAKINKIQQITKSMFPGNPGNTIVSGIGNSGDGSTQGGGAVWLWDLDDVSIGTPLNGQYPTITDGDVLKYSAGDGKWVAGEGAGANILEGGIINANGGTANTTGNVVLQATSATNGNLEITNVSSNPTVKIYGPTGNTDFKGGLVQIDRLSYNSSIGQSNFTIHGRSQTDINAGTYTNGGNIFYGYTSHPQDTGTADAMQYAGRISQPLDIVNKSYVDSAIDTGGGGIGFTFKGTCDVTLPLDNAANSDVVEAEGNFYINVTGGTAYNSGTTAQNWKGIGGLTISADQLIIWSESSDRWFAGAVENDTTFVKVDGSNDMTGALTIVPASGSNGLVIKDGSTAKITLFKGGTAQFNGDITALANITTGGNINPSITATSSIGSSSKRFKDAYINAIETQNQSVMAQVIPKTTTTNFGDSSTPWNTGYFKQVNTTSLSTMGSISPAGSQNLGSGSAKWQIVFSEINTVKDIAPHNNSTPINFGSSGGLSNLTDGFFNFLGGSSANCIFHRCSSSSMSNPQWIIKGKTDANDGDPTKDLLAVIRVTGSGSDVIEYHGDISQSHDLVNKKYVDLSDWYTTQSAVINDPPWGSHTNKYRINSEKTVCYVYLNITASGSSATVNNGAVLTAGIVGSSANWPMVDTPFSIVLTDSSGNRTVATNNYVRASDGKIIMQGPFVAKTITANFSFSTVTGT